MRSVAVPTDAVRSRVDFVRALSLVDATMLVAVCFLRESMGPLVGFQYRWTLFLVIHTGIIAAVAVAFGRFSSVFFPQLSPDRYSWLAQADLCARALGCSGALQAIQLGLSPQRVVALAFVWVLTATGLRGVSEGKVFYLWRASNEACPVSS